MIEPPPWVAAVAFCAPFACAYLRDTALIFPTIIFFFLVVAYGWTAQKLNARNARKKDAKL